jgi:hypothetical protein
MGIELLVKIKNDLVMHIVFYVWHNVRYFNRKSDFNCIANNSNYLLRM